MRTPHAKSVEESPMPAQDTEMYECYKQRLSVLSERFESASSLPRERWSVIKFSHYQDNVTSMSFCIHNHKIDHTTVLVSYY
jgi:hypothetical protein